ncbi:MAG: hypothetical protein QXZ70_00855 [Candidatus Bathyarchaeia archaeon]
MRKTLLLLGLLIMFVGIIFLPLRNYPVSVEEYELRDYAKNTYQSEPFITAVSGNFSVGEKLFFNFTEGRYWGGDEEVFEPSVSYEDFAIPQHKIVGFTIQTPSGQNSSFEAYFVKAQSTFMIVFEGESDDLDPLPDGNLTLGNVGFECLIKRNGTYTIIAESIVPLISKTEIEMLTLDKDPPRIMSLWCIKNTATYPYQFFLPLGAALCCVGLIISVFAYKSKKKRSLPKHGTLRRRR